MDDNQLKAIIEIVNKIGEGDRLCRSRRACRNNINQRGATLKIAE